MSETFSHPGPHPFADSVSWQPDRGDLTPAIDSEGAKNPQPGAGPGAGRRETLPDRDLPAAGPEIGLRGWPIFDDYEILEEIARGGMGIVYKARQRSLNRVVALKMILAGRLTSRGTVDRFYQEARAAAVLDHPNIVPIYEIGEQEGHPYFTMACIEGRTLSALVKERGPLPPEEATALMRTIAEAVAFAHQHGVIHRDLKPDNILIDSHGRPRVTDFGLAKQVDENAGLTASGQIFGTPNYMAPEQAQGSGAVGPLADVYALGGILFFLITGRPPFTGKSLSDVLLQVIDRPPVQPRLLNPDTCPQLEAICLKCLEKDPARRYPSAAVLAAALQQPSTAETPILAPQPSASPSSTEPIPEVAPARKSSSRWMLALAAGGLAVVLLAGGLVIGLEELRSEPVAPESLPVTPSPRAGQAPLNLLGTPRRDFNLKVEMLGSQPGPGGVLRLPEGQTIQFRIETERNAYVGVWTIDSAGNVLQLFPNDYEMDNLFRAGQARTVPGTDYDIVAEDLKGIEHVRVVACVRRWRQPRGESQGPYQLFKTEEQKERWTRSLKLREKGVAEELLRYEVVPRP